MYNTHINNTHCPVVLTEGPPELVERLSGLLVEVHVVPQQLHIYLLTVLRQGRLRQLYQQDTYKEHFRSHITIIRFTEQH